MCVHGTQAPQLLEETFSENKVTTAKRLPAAAGVLAPVTRAEYPFNRAFNRDLGPQPKATSKGERWALAH
jgi:hypothetical protein